MFTLVFSQNTFYDISGFTGVDAAYEKPSNAEVTVKAGSLSVDECVQEIVSYLAEKVRSCCLTLLHSERPKLQRVLAVLSAIG